MLQDCRPLQLHVGPAKKKYIHLPQYLLVPLKLLSPFSLEPRAGDMSRCLVTNRSITIFGLQLAS